MYKSEQINSFHATYFSSLLPFNVFVLFCTALTLLRPRFGSIFVLFADFYPVIRDAFWIDWESFLGTLGILFDFCLDEQFLEKCNACAL